MNGRRAKAARRAEPPPVVDGEAERLREFVAQAHDRLHKGDTDAAHELLHGALGSGVYDGDVPPLLGLAGFDEEFRRLCIAHGVRASFVALDPVTPGRLLSGGDAQLDGYVNGAMRLQCSPSGLHLGRR